MFFKSKWKKKAFCAGFSMAFIGLTLSGCANTDEHMIQSMQDTQSIQDTQCTQQILDTGENAAVSEDSWENVTEEADVSDMEEMLWNMRQAAVQLYCELPDGGHIAASGFLMELTEDTIYICTNRHVIEGQEDWQVYFFDGTMIYGQNMGVSDIYDVGVVSVPLEEVPQELCADLKTVSINMEAWEKIGNAQPNIGLVRVGQNGDIMYTRTGKVLRILTDFLWGNGMKETEISLEQTSGDSGSALFDQDGYLISMVHGNSNDAGGERNWGIPLDGLILEYEKITGRTLQAKD